MEPPGPKTVTAPTMSRQRSAVEDLTHQKLQYLLNQFDVPRDLSPTQHVQLTYSVKDLRLIRAALVELDARRLLEEADVHALMSATDP